MAIVTVDELIKLAEDNERNIYILSGAFGGLTFLLLILVSVLFYHTSRLRSRARLLEQSLEHLLRINHNAAELGPKPRPGAGPRQDEMYTARGGYTNQGYGGGNGGQWGGQGTNSRGQGQGQNQSFISPQHQQMAQQFVTEVGKEIGKELMNEAKDAAKDELKGQFKSLF